MRTIRILLMAAVLASTLGIFAVPAAQASKEKVYEVEDEPMARFKHPAPGIELGADFRYRFIYDNARKMDKKEPQHDRIQHRPRARLWMKIKHSDDLESSIRLITEPRYFVRPDLPKQLIRHEILFDLLNFKLNNLFDLPLAATIGRQGMRMGTGWLLLDGTPLDGGRTGFFDGVRFTYDLPEETTADLVLVNNYADSAKWLKPFNDRDIDLAEQDERGVILYLSKKTSENSELDGYFIYKQDHNRAIGRDSSDSSEGDIYTLGTMMHGYFDQNWEYCLEFAPQFGHKNGKELSAFATNNRLTYHCKDDNNNRFHIGYEYLSGDDDSDKNFDRVWGRKDQWSVLHTGDIDSIDGRKYDSSNLHRLNLGWTTEPMENLTMESNYHLLFADENTSAGGTGGLSTSGTFRGQLLRNEINYKINEHISHRIETELFFPGDFYNDDRNDVAVLFRYAILLTW